MNKKIIVRHWRYENGEQKYIYDPPSTSPKPLIAGWYCLVYEVLNSQFNFEHWMESNMTGEYESDFRFNSGDPLYTVYIKEQRDAEFFTLNFI